MAFGDAAELQSCEEVSNVRSGPGIAVYSRPKYRETLLWQQGQCAWHAQLLWESHHPVSATGPEQWPATHVHVQFPHRHRLKSWTHDTP